MTRNRARKKSVRAQMAASGEPYSVAARKLGQTRTPGEAARDEVVARAEATLAAASARIEVRKVVTAGPAAVPALLGTAFSGSALGTIEPSALRFQYVVFRQRDTGLAQLALGLDVGPGLEAGPAPGARSVPREDPLELLMRLRPVTAARYAGEETVRGARCRKIAVTAAGPQAVLTAWVDDEHVRQVQAVTSKQAKRMAVALIATTVVTAQLWDFGVPVDSMDWRRPSALWSELARRPASVTWRVPRRRTGPAAPAAGGTQAGRGT